MSEVWERSAATGGALLVLLCIADHADDDGRAFPSIPRLAKRARLSERHVSRIIADLEGSGELTVTKRGAGYLSTRYVVNVAALGVVVGDDAGVGGDTVSGVTPASDGDDISSLGDDAGVGGSVIDPSKIHQYGFLEEATVKKVTRAFLEEMRQTFPELDVEDEWQRASNHANYRKATDKRRYFRNWLNKAQGWSNGTKAKSTSDLGWDSVPNRIDG